MKVRQVMSRQRALLLVRICVTIGLLVLIWQAVDGPAAFSLLVEASPVWLIAAIFVLTAQTFFSALRWRVTAHALGQFIPFGRAVREYYLSQLVNQSLPGGVLGDAGRAVRARHDVGLRTSGQAVVFERLAGQVVLFLVTLGAIIGVAVMPGGIVLPDWVPQLVAAALLGMMLLAAILWFVGKGGHAVAGQIRNWSHAFRVAVLHPRVLPQQIMLSLATTVLNLLAFAMCARAVGTDLPLVSIMIIVPLILFTMLVPVSVSGWGLREGAASVLFPVIGAAATQGFAASVAFGLVFMVSVLPAIPFLLISPDRQAGSQRNATPSGQGSSSAGIIGKKAPSDQTPNQLTPSTTFSSPSSTSR